MKFSNVYIWVYCFRDEIGNLIYVWDRDNFLFGGFEMYNLNNNIFSLLINVKEISVL